MPLHFFGTSPLPSRVRPPGFYQKIRETILPDVPASHWLHRHYRSPSALYFPKVSWLWPNGFRYISGFPAPAALPQSACFSRREQRTGPAPAPPALHPAVPPEPWRWVPGYNIPPPHERDASLAVPQAGNSSRPLPRELLTKPDSRRLSMCFRPSLPIRSCRQPRTLRQHCVRPPLVSAGSGAMPGFSLPQKFPRKPRIPLPASAAFSPQTLPAAYLSSSMPVIFVLIPCLIAAFFMKNGKPYPTAIKCVEIIIIGHHFTTYSFTFP